MQKRVVVIGGGVGGLAAACLLAKAGHLVTVLEKNEQLGGRAGQLRAKGFTFDTGPSWYLMPEVFERFFHLLGENVEDYLSLAKLSPNYRVFYKGLGQQADLTGDLAKDMATFENIEPGAGGQLKRYLAHASFLYNTSMEWFLYKNYNWRSDFMNPEVMKAATKLSIFSSMHRQAARYFKDQRLQQIVEYPAVFLGGSPYNTPALFSLLNHSLLTMKGLYPIGGIYKLVEALVAIGKKHGVQYETGAAVEKILIENGEVGGVLVGGKQFSADIVVSGAGRWHTETALLEARHRDYSARYWAGRTVAPSALLLYLGVKGRCPSLAHHNLLFSQSWRRNFADIFGGAAFPADPSLYVYAPSKTDPGVAPKGHENLFVLVPVAAGLSYTAEQLDKFTGHILRTIETELHLPGLRQHIVYQHHFCVADFASRFNSLAGSGLGLAHTLKQSAFFRPANRSKKVRGLYYVGADTHPGIGLPPALISAELLYRLEALRS